MLDCYYFCLSYFSQIKVLQIKCLIILKNFSSLSAWRPGGASMGAVENLLNNKEHPLPGEAKKILLSLASRWSDVIDPSALQIVPLKGAMTNEVYQIKWPTETKPSRKVLVRIYGTGVDLFFDRNDEIRTFEFMSKHGQGPLLLGRFPNGRIEEFIHARVGYLLFFVFAENFLSSFWAFGS